MEGEIFGGLFGLFFLWGLWEWSKRMKKNNEEKNDAQPRDDVISIQGSYPQLTLDDLVGDSDLIIIGKVIEILPAKVDTIEGWGKELIYTDVIVEVEKSLYGHAEKIAIRVSGGTTGDVTMKAPDAPVFYLGEEVCVLLRHPLHDLIPPLGFDLTNYYKVVGDKMGKGTYKDGSMIRDAGDSISISKIEQHIKSIHRQ